MFTLNFDLGEQQGELTLTLTPPSAHVHVGAWVDVTAQVTPYADVSELKVVWTLVEAPPKSSTGLMPIGDDTLSVAFVPDKVGVYRVQARVMREDHRSVSVESSFVARQIPLPHGLAANANMQWMSSFLRDWTRMIEDKSTAEALWSSYVEVASQALIRLYEVNLSKSISTIPELVQKRRHQLRIRVSLGDAYTLQGSPRHYGQSAVVTGDTAWVEGITSITQGRPLVLDGVCVRALSTGAQRSAVDKDGNVVQGAATRVRSIAEKTLRPVLWSLPSAWFRLHTDEGVSRSLLYDLGCRAGDLLVVDFSLDGRTHPIVCRVWGVSREGDVCFEWTDDPVTDDFAYFDAKGTLNSRVQAIWTDLFYKLRIDAGQNGYAALARQWTHLLLRGKHEEVAQMWGVSLQLRSILRLSTYQVPYDTVSVPFLQSNVVDPVFVLRENDDYVLEDQPTDTQRGTERYVRLAKTVRLDEDSLPDAFWADVLFLDNAQNIEANFGYLVGAVRDRLPDSIVAHEKYRGVVGGLMYAFSHGPTLRNLRIGVQAVLGLPLATHDGKIRGIHRNTNGERLVVVEDTLYGKPTGYYRTYLVPEHANIEMNEATGVEYAVGDDIVEYTPLCTGVVITDWIKSPDWWFSLYDGKVKLPSPHKAFVDSAWFPQEGVLWPEEALSEFEEIQKVHIFSVQLDAQVYDVDDTKLARDFVRGVHETWRRGAEKKGMRPHYTYPLFVVWLSLVDRLDIRDRFQGTAYARLVSDITGYEATLSEGSRNTSGALLTYVDGALYASRTPYRQSVQFAAPPYSGAPQTGTVLLILDVYDGILTQGTTVTGSRSGAIAEVVEIDSAHMLDAPATHFAWVSYAGSSAPFREGDILTDGSTYSASVMFCVVVCVRKADGSSWSRDANDPDAAYRYVRDRDVLVVEDGAYRGQYRIVGIDRDDTTLAYLSAWRADDPSAPPPLPFGVSDPYGQSSYNPYTTGTLTVWHEDTQTQHAHVLRPMTNPLYSPETYWTPVTTHALDWPSLPAGFIDAPPASQHQQDLFRAGCLVRLVNPAHAKHQSIYEVVRETNGSDADEITVADLEGWDEGTPALRLWGESTSTGLASMFHEILDPRLPRPVYQEGATLPVQVVPDDFSVLLPALSPAVDDVYVGCYMQAISGAGAYDGSAQQGWWPIIAYNGMTKVATLARNHRGVFDNTTVIRIVSFRRTDVALALHNIHTMFPASLLEHRLFGAVKSGDTIGGGGPSYCSISTTAGNGTLTISNVGNIRPAGKALLTANVLGDAPFELGVAQAGDILILHAQDINDRRNSSILYEVQSIIAANQLVVSPPPPDTSTLPMYFTIYRASPVIYAWDGFAYVAGTPTLFTPVPEWSIF